MTPGACLLRVTQVVPCLPLGQEAVGSYALHLGRRIEEPHDGRRAIAVSYLAGAFSEADEQPTEISGACAVVEPRTADALAGSLDRSGTEVVFLHYSAYGFHPRGCPEWLVRGIERWRDAGPDRRLVTLFHEVYATGPPWRSSFWLVPRQKRLARRLLERSTYAVTTTELYADLLEGLFAGRGAPVTPQVLPVFSTIGEPDLESVPPLDARARRLVVFGGPGPRARAWTECRRDLELACLALDVEEVFDLGPGGDLDGPPTQVAGCPVRVLGRIPRRELSQILLDSLAGFLAYPPDLLGKSTVFAAYSAHGLLPVCSPWGGRRDPGDPLSERLWWQPTPGGASRPQILQEIADRAHAWYRRHRLDAQGALFRRLLQNLEER